MNASENARRHRITPALTFVLALACGGVVANIYYVQPLIGPISRDFGLSVAAAGLLVTVSRLRHALRDGWIARRDGGHDVFKHPDRKGRIVLPRHRELSIGVARAVAKQAGWRLRLP